MNIDQRIKFVQTDPRLAEQIDKAMANTAKAIHAQFQCCPICQQPVGSNHPEADVYHMACLMEIMRPQ